MSLQVGILKVLSGHPGGRATVSDLNSDLAFLNSIGAEWTDRIRRLAARAPALNIFGQGLVLRHEDGWQITTAGRDLLTAIEAPGFAPPPAIEAPAVRPAADQPVSTANVIRLEDHRRRRDAIKRRRSSRRLRKRDQDRGQTG
ncbi:hypothetical protein HUU61_22295 [Rhodopseudomonas palustris]|nr:hypothetical protein [Rhodopseudomonas palustris]